MKNIPTNVVYKHVDASIVTVPIPLSVSTGHLKSCNSWETISLKVFDFTLHFSSAISLIELMHTI